MAGGLGTWQTSLAIFRTFRHVRLVRDAGEDATAQTERARNIHTGEENMVESKQYNFDDSTS